MYDLKPKVTHTHYGYKAEVFDALSPDVVNFKVSHIKCSKLYTVVSIDGGSLR